MSLILGGGISGLTAAFYALKSAPKSCTITLLESSERLGGWVKSIQTKEGLIFEKGPRTIRPFGKQGANTLKLVEDLGLTDLVKPINKAHPTAQNRLIYVKNELHKLPSSFGALFKTHTPFTKPLIFSILHDLKAKSKSKMDDSLYEFTARRFGKEIADYAISAMICGICAGDAKKISVNFLMSELFKMEQKHGGVIKGALKQMFGKKMDLTAFAESDLFKRSRLEKWSVWSVQGGLETLVQTLAKQVQNDVDIKLSTACTKLNFREKCVEATLSNSQHIETYHIISSLPAPKLSTLLPEEHVTLANLLKSIEHVHVAVVNLAYKNVQLKQNAFGFLVPPNQKLPILGVIFDSCCFQQDDWTVLTVMMGGAWYDEYLKGKSKEDMLNVACKYVHEILDVPQDPQSYHVDILYDCIPQYTLGHSERLQEIQNYISSKKLPLYLTGSSYEGVGINDVIMASKQTVDNIKWNHWGPQAG